MNNCFLFVHLDTCLVWAICCLYSWVTHFVPWDGWPDMGPVVPHLHIHLSLLSSASVGTQRLNDSFSSCNRVYCNHAWSAGGMHTSDGFLHCCFCIAFQKNACSCLFSFSYFIRSSLKSTKYESFAFELCPQLSVNCLQFFLTPPG